jgi:hypothetical protein
VGTDCEPPRSARNPRGFLEVGNATVWFINADAEEAPACLQRELKGAQSWPLVPPSVKVRKWLLLSRMQLTCRIVSTLVPGEYIGVVDSKRNQLETRVATLELMLVTERARPKPDKREMEKLEKELTAARSALHEYNEEHPS